jgi:hypothetical protein
MAVETSAVGLVLTAPSVGVGIGSGARFGPIRLPLGQPGSEWGISENRHMARNSGPRPHN